MAAFVNKYAGICSNPACKKPVSVGAGYITKPQNTWLTWCTDCVPEKKSTPAPQRRELTADGRIFIPYDPNAVALIKTLKGPEGKNNPAYDASTKSWKVSIDMGDRPRLLDVAKRLQLSVPESLQTIVLTESAQNAKESNLYDFQIDGVNWLSCRQKGLLGDDMGLGKTVQSLMALPRTKNVRGLAVVPSAVKYNWKKECEKWRDDIKPVVIEGRGNFRFPKDGELVIVNYEILPEWLDPNPPVVKIINGKPTKLKVTKKKTWKELAAWQEQLAKDHPEAANVNVLYDEAHKVKNYKAGRSVRTRELSCLVSALGGKIWVLTGTPLDNKEEDLYGILHATNMAYEAFTPRKGQNCFQRFQELFQARKTRFGTEYDGPLPIVPELLRRVMLRRLRTEVLPNLPRKTYTNMVVGEISSKLQRLLDEFWEKHGLALELEDALPPFEQFSEIRAQIAKNNIPAMLEYVEECEEQNVPLVVFSSHLSPMDELLCRPGWAVITGATSPVKRQEIVDAFQSGHLKGVGITIRAGGVGLTLTRAWKALFVDLDWVPGWNAQAEDRLCRIGQMNNKVEIIRMVNDHPLTLHVLNLLARKIALIEASVERLMKVNVPVSASKTGTETEAEYQARMQRIQEANDNLAKEQEMLSKQKAKAKVDMIYNREKAKFTNTLPPLTAERQEAVRNAFKFMLSVCDGACERDSQGFNKPDAVVAHYLLTAGLETQQEVEAGYFLLSRYHRQLKGKYPILFS